MGRRYSETEESFWQKLVLPEEDKRLSGIEWTGGYRWFRSENVIPIEHYRRDPAKPDANRPAA